jgi:hypothetical protein
VLVSKVVVHLRPRSADPSPRSAALGSRIDLDNIQTIMESMGSRLSPGAQQLMSMIRFQQQASRDIFYYTLKCHFGEMVQ